MRKIHAGQRFMSNNWRTTPRARNSATIAVLSVSSPLRLPLSPSGWGDVTASTAMLAESLLCQFPPGVGAKSFLPNFDVDVSGCNTCPVWLGRTTPPRACTHITAAPDFNKCFAVARRKLCDLKLSVLIPACCIIFSIRLASFSDPRQFCGDFSCRNKNNPCAFR